MRHVHEDLADEHDNVFSRLGKRYLLVTNVPHYVDDAGPIFLERVWHHDLVRHLTYLPFLKIASPALTRSDHADLDLVPVEDSPHRFIPLPEQSSGLSALRALPTTARQLFAAVGDADIVHSGVAGWPYPLGWLATTFAKLRARRLVIVVESAPWRLSSAEERKLPRKRIRAMLYEQLARWSCGAADLALFTQPAYRETLLRHPRPGAYVTPATWINAENVLSDARARKLWEGRGEATRLLFAARLTTEKGTDFLLDALRELERRRIPVQVDVIGTGDREAAVDEAAAALRTVQLRRLDPVPYGPEFFALLDGYHAVLVPSLSDEQPRIFFDAAARAVPTIAADTDGLRPHVADRRTGLLFPRGNLEALTDLLTEVIATPRLFQRLGLEVLRVARSQTHSAMHARRSQLLAAHVG